MKLDVIVNPFTIKVKRVRRERMKIKQNQRSRAPKVLSAEVSRSTVVRSFLVDANLWMMLCDHMMKFQQNSLAVLQLTRNVLFTNPVTHGKGVVRILPIPSDESAEDKFSFCVIRNPPHNYNVIYIFPDPSSIAIAMDTFFIQQYCAIVML